MIERLTESPMPMPSAFRRVKRIEQFRPCSRQSRPTPASRTVTRTRSPSSRSVLISKCRGRSCTPTIASDAFRSRFRIDLLELDAVAGDQWEIVGELRLKNDPVSLKSLNDSAMTSRVASFRSSGSSVNSFLLNSARNRVITSAARLPSRIVRLAVSRAPSMSGGSAASIRRQVPALVMMPESGWFTSWAIEAVNALTVVTRATWASSERALFRASSATFALSHILEGTDEHGLPGHAFR